MNRYEERKIAEYLWEGNLEVLDLMKRIKTQYKRYPEIIKWLAMNQIKGQRIFDFFYEANGRKSNAILPGIKQILIRIDNDKFNKDALTIKELK
ncbi:MAG: hypothetical protein GY861_17755 [bacterium]|nr:hypothetical protein [bacterium]